jgi:cobalamin biosynthesis protein CbiG
MVQDDFLQLHDRATRGEELTSEEQKLLEVWYSARDCAEMEALGLATKEGTAPDSLRPQVDSALAQLTIVTGRINTLAKENERLRQENALLRRQVAERPAPQLV